LFRPFVEKQFDNPIY